MLSLLLSLTPAHVSADESVYSFTLHKPEDSITIRADYQRTVFVITSESGIGKAEMTLKAGQWPRGIVLRFHYSDGRGFQSLEGFTLTTGHRQIRVSLGFADKESHSDAPSETPQLTAARRAGTVEIDVPTDLLVGSKQIHFEWIDAYRR